MEGANPPRTMISCWALWMLMVSTRNSFVNSYYCALLIEYAQVTKMLGNGRVEAQCFDGEKRLAHIRGKMRKKVPTESTLLSIID